VRGVDRHHRPGELHVRRVHDVDARRRGGSDAAFNVAMISEPFVTAAIVDALPCQTISAFLASMAIRPFAT